MSAGEIELLQSMAVFGAVSGETLALILERSEKVRVSTGQYFLHEGDEAQAFYVLESGRVRVQRQFNDQDFCLAELGPGDCFGEMALIECRVRSASVIAVEDCVALRVPFSVLQTVSERDLEQFTLIQMNIARELSRRLREADRHLFEAWMSGSQPAGDCRWMLL